MKKETRNSKVLKDFVKYCEAHPNERFWQAVRNWSEAAFIWWDNKGCQPIDTFYWEDNNK